MNFKPKTFASGKIVYWVDYCSFENTENRADGKQKAINYCLQNNLDINDIKKFDSRLERDYWEYLLDKQDKGEISKVKHHFLVRIQEEFTNSAGQLIPQITYETDFTYYDNIKKEHVVVDVKGSEYFIDERFLTIKSLFDYKFKHSNVYIRIIMRNSNNEWYEWKIGDKKKSQKLIKKQRDKIASLKADLREQNKLIQKKFKERERYRQLVHKEDTGAKLTAQERARKDEIELHFKEWGETL